MTSLMEERQTQVQRLFDAGHNVTAQGMFKDGWDIEVCVVSENSGEYLSLGTVAEVDEFLANHTVEVPVISILWTLRDVEDMASSAGIDVELATERALEWGKHIEGTLNGYAAEQLGSVVLTGQP